MSPAGEMFIHFFINNGELFEFHEKSQLADQLSGSERPIGSQKISDFHLNCVSLTDKHVSQSSPWCLTSGHFHCFCFFKPIRIDPVTELSPVARFVKLDSRYEIGLRVTLGHSVTLGGGEGTQLFATLTVWIRLKTPISGSTIRYNFFVLGKRCLRGEGRKTCLKIITKTKQNKQLKNNDKQYYKPKIMDETINLHVRLNI